MKKIFLILALTAFLFSKNTNMLINEESFYLQSHAHDLVDWLPWTKESLNRAKKEHKPIFLSIGYSTCHWCNVMKMESFKNEEIAKLINENFIPIKVDKEERPDIDKYYQKIYQIIHKRSGGWPLTIILTEDLKPFFAATYLPPEDGYGVKGLKTVLPILAKAYKEDKKEIEKRADAILSLMKKIEDAQYVPVHLDLAIAKKYVKQNRDYFDKVYKGFSKRVKFPEASRIKTLLDIYMILGDKDAFSMANETLIFMAKGGIYDQVEGGFFRYTTDRKWQIPHFEKMLYTNALMIDIYTRAYKITKNELFERVVLETIKEIDFRFGKDGLYFSASDADSDGVEGGYFIYDYAKTYNFFRKKGFEDSKIKKILAYFGIKEDGNIDGDSSNPNISSSISLSSEDIKKAKKVLKEIREYKKYPFIDKKIITAWNAMYIDAKLKASYINSSFKKEALKSLDKLVKSLYIDENLYHQKLSFKNPTKMAFLEDYAYLIKALFSAYQFSLEKRYLNLAKKLLKEAKKRFFIKNRWYFNNKEFRVVADLDDSYYTSPLSIMIHNFLTATILFEDLEYLKDANYIINKNSALIFHNPASFPEATRAVLRVKVGDIVIKNNKEAILKNLKKILDIKYPYIFTKENSVDRFLVCKIDSCFLETKNIKNVKGTIEDLLKFKKSDQGWKKRLRVDER